VRANERNAALLAAYTPKPGKPFTEATDPIMMIDAPSFNSGNGMAAFDRPFSRPN